MLDLLLDHIGNVQKMDCRECSILNLVMKALQSINEPEILLEGITIPTEMLAARAPQAKTLQPLYLQLKILIYKPTNQSNTARNKGCNLYFDPLKNKSHFFFGLSIELRKHHSSLVSANQLFR